MSFHRFIEIVYGSVSIEEKNNFRLIVWKYFLFYFRCFAFHTRTHISIFFQFIKRFLLCYLFSIKFLPISRHIFRLWRRRKWSMQCWWSNANATKPWYRISCCTWINIANDSNDSVCTAWWHDWCCFICRC